MSCHPFQFSFGYLASHSFYVFVSDTFFSLPFFLYSPLPVYIYFINVTLSLVSHSLIHLTFYLPFFNSALLYCLVVKRRRSVTAWDWVKLNCIQFSFHFVFVLIITSIPTSHSIMRVIHYTSYLVSLFVGLILSSASYGEAITVIHEVSTFNNWRFVGGNCIGLWKLEIKECKWILKSILLMLD